VHHLVAVCITRVLQMSHLSVLQCVAVWCRISRHTCSSHVTRRCYIIRVYIYLQEPNLYVYIYTPPLIYTHISHVTRGAYIYTCDEHNRGLYMYMYIRIYLHIYMALLNTHTYNYIQYIYVNIGSHLIWRHCHLGLWIHMHLYIYCSYIYIYLYPYTYVYI